jgi:ketosteroid isomerase-like protein
MENKNFSPDQQAVMNAILDMTTAFHKKDIERVMASYEKNAVIVFEPEKPVDDPEGMRQGFFRFFAVNPKFEYSGHEVFVIGELAVHFAPWIMSGKTPDGVEIKQSGLSVAVLRKQTNGKWLMLFDNPFGQHLLDKVKK